VQPGDTLPLIASYFGISIDTIVGANPKMKSGTPTAGTILKILPVSGILYISRAGDTLQSIASSFNIQEDQIVDANPSVHFDPSLLGISSVNPGVPLIIPGGKNAITTSPSTGS
jgi:LysM repeat protein